jgi:phosphoglycerol transferase MdoB-like AlkP superfamily enzyme
MNKKVNTLLFLLGATLFNILVAILSFILLTVLYVNFLMPMVPEASRSWNFTLIFLAAIVISFITYRKLFKYLINKIDAEKYFDPIFTGRYSKKK